MKTKKGLRLIIIMAVTILLITGTATCSFAAEKKANNVILMIPDGTSITHITLARWYQGGAPLALDQIASGLVRCYSAESAISDSAPAATAMASGFKSNNEFIGVLPAIVTMPNVPAVAEADRCRPVASVLEGARLLGKSTGLVVTANVQHATPAAFSAHTQDRRDYEGIGEQQVYGGIDVVLGGGSKYLSPERKDGENLTEVLKANGYEVVNTRDQMINSTSEKLWGLFAEDMMAHDFDRDSSREPALFEMTRKAIEILSKNSKGFFLMVEGSQVDQASHANDPVGVVSDMLAFDKAVKVALDFAKRDGKTLVIVAPDHGNGGMSIGDAGTNGNYDTTDISNYLGVLKRAGLTGRGIEDRLNADRSNIVEVMSGNYGVRNLTEDEIAAVKNAPKGKVQAVVGPIISKRANIGWTTIGHTGDDVALYSYGPGRPQGVIDNTDIAEIIAGTFGFDLAELNKKLFVPAEKGLESLGAEVVINESDPYNPVVEAVKGNIKMELPVNTSIVKINGQAAYMNGITVVSRDIPYVPQEAIDLFMAAAAK